MPAQTKTDKQRVPAKTRIVRSVEKSEPERDFFKWIAPSRPFKRRDREFWVTILAIAGVTGLILFVIEGVMPVILIISLIFLFYILTTVEPENIGYKITNYGVWIAEKRTDWDDIKRFWFARRFNSELLIFDTLIMPGRLELVVNGKEKEKVRKVLSEFLAEEESPASYLDKTANWFSKKLPQ